MEWGCGGARDEPLMRNGEATATKENGNHREGMAMMAAEVAFFEMGYSKRT